MTLSEEKKQYQEHLEAQEAFETAFDEAGLPDAIRGEMKKFTKGNLTVKIGFNADYDNFYPIITFWAFGNKIHVFGQKMSERLNYRSEGVVNKIYDDEIDDAIESAKHLVNNIETFTSTLSLDTFDRGAISFRVYMICMTYKFGIQS